MRALFLIALALGLSAALGIGAAWYLRPVDEGPVTGPGFDPDFVSPSGTLAPTRVEGGSSSAAQAPSAADLWNERNNAALDALAKGDLDTALAELRACHQANPDNPTFLRNLVETLARLARGLWTQGDRQEAIWKLEEAIELSLGLPEPDARGDLVKLLERWKREFAVESDFWEDVSQHFELSYDASHQDLLHGYQEVLDRAEAAYSDLRDFLSFDPVFESGRRLRITLYRRERFQEVTGLESWAGGAFDGTIRLPVSDLAQQLHAMDLLLRHELTHAFLDAAPTGGPVPGWFNEGLAQYLSGEGPQVRRNAKETLAAGPLSLDSLTGTFARWTDPEAVARAYTQSLITVEAIAERYGKRLLADLLADLGDTDTNPALAPEARLEAAFTRRTGWTLPELIAETIEQL